MSEELNTPTVEGSVDDMFAGMKKKKKSKKVNFDEEVEAPVAAVPVVAAPSSSSTVIPSIEKVAKVVAEPIVAASEGGEEALDFSDLKKKKKKKSVKLVLSDDEDEAPKEVKMVRKVDNMGNETYVPAEADETVEGDEANEFADMKKKKKKGSKKAAFDDFEKELLEEAEAGTGEGSSAAATPLGSDGEEDGPDEEAVEDGLFGNDAEESTLSKAEMAAQAKAWLADDRDYTYTELLGRFYSLLYASHPSLSAAGSKKKYTIPPPQIHREGNKRSIFVNIVDICKRMHRSPDHVIQFLFAELGTSGSVDGSGRLVIKGRFQQKQIENVLRRYIVEYVQCKTCKSSDTVLTKDNRLFFMNCGTCASTRSVSAIKSGFQAQTGKRRAMRAA